MELSMNERKEVKDFIKEMSSLADIITMIRTENELLKKQLAKETAAKEAAVKREQQGIVKRQESEKQRQVLKYRVKELEKEKEELEEGKKELEEEKEELEEEKEEHILLIKDMKINLKTTDEKLKRRQAEVIVCVDKLHESVKLVAETDHELEYVKSKNTFLNSEAEHHMKYRNNYDQRKNFYGFIMEDLAKLEDLTTQFSIFRRRSTKRRYLNRIRDNLQKSMGNYIQ